MRDEQLCEAQLKLQAYQAAINACSASRSYAMQGMGDRGATVNEIKNEAERLWAWMTGEDKKPG